MKTPLYFFLLLILSGCAEGNPKIASSSNPGGPCEGCEAIHESPVPFGNLSWTDTLPDFKEGSPGMRVYGRVYKPDEKTPAPGVVIYIYHTDQQGLYSRGDETKWGRRHGYLRGWVKSNQQGAYEFFTTRPAPYPDAQEPAHIHMTLKEPGKNEYYIDDIIFADTSPEAFQKKQNNRGGSGVVNVRKENGLELAERNIYLGKNIPGYN